MLDVLDENGIKTGEVLTRKEVHRLGLWHKIIVIAIIDENNQILMQQRSFIKDTNPGKWDISAAGHVSAGQTSLEASVREINEEVGISIEIDMNKIVLQESEVAGAKLVTKEEFKEMVETGNMVKRPEFYKALLDYLF